MADILLAEVTAADAECAGVLALNLAYYQATYGELPLEETLVMVDLTEPARLGGNFRLTGWKYLSGTRNFGSSLGRSEALGACSMRNLHGGITA